MDRKCDVCGSSMARSYRVHRGDEIYDEISARLRAAVVCDECECEWHRRLENKEWLAGWVCGFACGVIASVLFYLAHRAW